jgi:hypothetical protein
MRNSRRSLASIALEVDEARIDARRVEASDVEALAAEYHHVADVHVPQTPGGGTPVLLDLNVSRRSGDAKPGSRRPSLLPCPRKASAERDVLLEDARMGRNLRTRLHFPRTECPV